MELTSGRELNYRFPSSEKSLYGGQVGIFSDLTMLDGMVLKITLTVQQIYLFKTMFLLVLTIILNAY